MTKGQELGGVWEQLLDGEQQEDVEQVLSSSSSYQHVPAPAAFIPCSMSASLLELLTHPHKLPCGTAQSQEVSKWG